MPDDSQFSWATVYSDNPITIRKDGETEPIGVTPQSVVPLSMLRTGERVWCQFVNRRALILGRAGGAWPEIASGYVAVPGGDGTASKVTVTFPRGRFSSPPSVTASPQTSVPGTTVKGVGAGNVSKTSFDLYLLRTNTTTTGVSWIAVQEA